MNNLYARQEVTMNWKDAPDTINPIIYSKIRGVSPQKAREIFNSKGFPRLKGTGTKQLADKRAVYLYEIGLSEEDRREVLKEIARQII